MFFIFFVRIENNFQSPFFCFQRRLSRERRSTLEQKSTVQTVGASSYLSTVTRMIQCNIDRRVHRAGPITFGLLCRRLSTKSSFFFLYSEMTGTGMKPIKGDGKRNKRNSLKRKRERERERGREGNTVQKQRGNNSFQFGEKYFFKNTCRESFANLDLISRLLNLLGRPQT